MKMASVLSPVSPGNKDDDDSPNIILKCVILATSKANSHGQTSIIYASKLSKDDAIEGNPFRVYNRQGRYIWDNRELMKYRIRVGSVLKYVEFGGIAVYERNIRVQTWTVEQIQMNLEYGVNAYKSIKEACPNVMFGQSRGMHLSSEPENPVIFLVSIRYGVIQNERIQFATRAGEFADLKLNCREHLTMSLAPSYLPLRHLTDVEDVGDVMVVKFDTSDIGLRSPMYSAVCEGLILRYKPKVISIDEEPVKIKNGDGKFILFPGLVKFDSGNDVGTGISYEFLDKLGLLDQVDNRKKTRFTTSGRDDNGNEISVHCSRVTIKLKIRKHVFTVNALAGAPAPNVGLLIGMDIIEKLNDANFTLGK